MRHWVIMKKLKIFANFILCFIILSSKTFSFEIIFPSDNITVSSSDIHIVARFENPSNVSVKTESGIMKGTLIPSKDIDGEKFYMLMNVIKLKNGLNRFVVIQGKQQKEISVVKVDNPVVMEDWTQSMTNFHSSPEKTKICISCHKFQSMMDCVNCHKDRLLGKWVHKPVREGACFDCHEKSTYFRVKEPSSDVCLNCHKDLRQVIEKSDRIHGPVAGGYCTICHSPHKNNVQTHLRKSMQDLCNQCHKSDLLGYTYHSSNYIKNHPVSSKIIKKTGKILNCGSCHNPHAANNQKLLNLQNVSLSDFCLQCHDEKVDVLVEQLRKKGVSNDK